MVTNEVLLKAEKLDLSFGGVAALRGVSLGVRKGEIFSVIGPNGAGKTSLLNSINGFYRPEKGEVYFEGKRITHFPPHRVAALGIARTFQNLALYTGMTTLDNLLAGRHIHMKANVISGGVWFQLAQKEEIQHRRAVEGIIDFLEMEAIRNKVVGSLPYGLRKRVELGRALALEPELLLLDEPMAGMNVEEKEDMARFILDVYERQGVTIILIEHDIGAVLDISDRIMVLDFGTTIAEGSPQEIRTNPRVISAYLGEERITY